MNIAWWKWVGVALLLYTFIIGMTIPLGPGIISIDNGTVDKGIVEGGSSYKMSIETYNTKFSDGGGIRAWLKLDSLYSLSANGINVVSDRQINVEFDIPSRLPDRGERASMTLIVDHDKSGTMVLPRAVFFRASEGISNSDWKKDHIQDLTIRTGMRFPYRSLLVETVRNTFFHVAFWMAMFTILCGAAYYAFQYLRTRELQFDMWSQSLTEVGLLYGLIGLFTGMVWGNYTWGDPWPPDVKLNMTAIAIMIYIAYFLLRSSISEWHQKARLASVYNLFAFVSLFPLLFVIPRMVDSLHPGNGGNPAFGSEDLDSTLRMVFYPAIMGWILFGIWMAQLHYRILKIKKR